EPRQPGLDELGRGPVRTLVRVQAHRHVDLRGVVAVEQTQVVARRDQRRHRLLPHGTRAPGTSDARWAARVSTDRAGPGRPSAAASTRNAGATRASPSSLARTTCMCLRNVSTRSAPENRAARDVGSTWFTPAT